MLKSGCLMRLVEEVMRLEEDDANEYNEIVEQGKGVER